MCLYRASAWCSSTSYPESGLCGDFADAIWHSERAGDGAANQYGCGLTLTRLNRFAEARAHLQKSLEADHN